MLKKYGSTGKQPETAAFIMLKNRWSNHQIEMSKAETDRETYLFSAFMEEKEK